MEKPEEAQMGLHDEISCIIVLLLPLVKHLNACDVYSISVQVPGTPNVLYVSKIWRIVIFFYAIEVCFLGMTTILQVNKVQ